MSTHAACVRKLSIVFRCADNFLQAEATRTFQGIHEHPLYHVARINRRGRDSQRTVDPIWCGQVIFQTDTASGHRLIGSRARAASGFFIKRSRRLATA
jgi:hypothetical protein